MWFLYLVLKGFSVSPMYVYIYIYIYIYIYTYISKKQQELNELRQTVLLK